MFLNNLPVVDFSSNQDITDLKDNVNNITGETYTDAEISFVLWYIFPVQLASGVNILQATSVADGFNNVMGVEVYDNTKAEIMSATNLNELNILFSSINYLSQQMF